MPFRAFVGIPVGAEPPLVALLGGLAGTGAGLKLVDPQHLHLTLAFLGDVPDDAAPRIGAALDAAAKGSPPFEMAFRGAGAFPSAGRPRIVWVGVVDPGPPTALALRVRAALKEAGFSMDEKEFRAHVTLGRARDDRLAERAAAFLREHARDELGSVPVREARLYRSTLGPRGPAYDALHAARLEG